MAGQTIPRADVDRYFAYSLQFYAWAYGLSGSPKAACAGSLQARCVALQRQTLRRLIQEDAVLAYARRHKIGLTPADNLRVQRAADNLASPDSTTSDLFTSRGMGRSFVRNLVARETIIRKVEGRVTPASTRHGLALLVRRYTFVPGTVLTGRRAHREATQLVTNGGPLPLDAHFRQEWVAPFRLPARERVTLAVASPGDFVGPFKQSGAWVVFQLVQRRDHAYGRPARYQLESAAFRAWIARLLKRDPPVCFNGTGGRIPCP